MDQDVFSTAGIMKGIRVAWKPNCHPPTHPRSKMKIHLASRVFPSRVLYLEPRAHYVGRVNVVIGLECARPNDMLFLPSVTL
jgi:hypothetical protein